MCFLLYPTQFYHNKNISHHIIYVIKYWLLLYMYNHYVVIYNFIKIYCKFYTVGKWKQCINNCCLWLKLNVSQHTKYKFYYKKLSEMCIFIYIIYHFCSQVTSFFFYTISFNTSDLFYFQSISMHRRDRIWIIHTLWNCKERLYSNTSSTIWYTVNPMAMT